MQGRRRPTFRALLRVVPCLALAAAASRPAAAQDASRPLGAWRVAAQVGSGVALTPVGFVGGGLATRWVARRLGAGEDRASDAAYVGAWTASGLATAAGPALVGARGPGRGSYLSAVAGTAVGGAVSFAIVRINKRLAARDGGTRPCRALCTLSGIAVFLLPSVGATVGYDMSRR